jgi:hypothetical protein
MCYVYEECLMCFVFLCNFSPQILEISVGFVSLNSCACYKF